MKSTRIAAEASCVRFRSCRFANAFLLALAMLTFPIDSSQSAENQGLSSIDEKTSILEDMLKRSYEREEKLKAKKLNGGIAFSAETMLAIKRLRATEKFIEQQNLAEPADDPNKVVWTFVHDFWNPATTGLYVFDRDSNKLIEKYDITRTTPIKLRLPEGTHVIVEQGKEAYSYMQCGQLDRGSANYVGRDNAGEKIYQYRLSQFKPCSTPSPPSDPIEDAGRQSSDDYVKRETEKMRQETIRMQESIRLETQQICIRMGSCYY